MDETVDLLRQGIDLLAADRLEHDVRRELIELERLRSRLDAEIARRTAALDRTGSWALDGQLSLRSWLVERLRCARRDAHQRVRRARQLDQHPGTAAAWFAGELTSAHVAVILDAAHHANAPGAYAEFEPTVVEIARRYTPEETATATQAWRHALDDARQRPTDTLARRQYEQRGLHLAEGYAGTTFLHATLDPTDADLVRGALDAEYERLHQAGDDRTPAQQRLDALCSIIRQHRADTEPAGRAEPHVAMVTDLETYLGLRHDLCQTADGVPVARETMLRAACAGVVQLLVTDDHGVPLALGRARRTFNRAQRRAITYRDGHCRFPGCTRPPRDCEVHHVIPWGPPHHGRTDLTNGILLCYQHHHYVHELRWKLELLANGDCRWQSPSAIVPTTTEPRCRQHAHRPDHAAAA